MDTVEPAIFVSRLNRVCAAVIAALVVVLVLALVLGGRVPGAVPATVLGGTAALAAVWLVLWNPRIEVDDREVRLVNVTRTVAVPWSQLRQVDTRLALTLVTDEHRYVAWTAPAPGRPATRAAQRRQRRPEGESWGVRPGDLPGTASGDAAAMVRTVWQRWEDAVSAVPGPAPDRDAAVGVRWHAPEGAVIGALVLAARLI